MVENTPHIDLRFDSNSRRRTISPIYQYDHGRSFHIYGIESSKSVTFQYSFEGMLETLTVIGTSSGDYFNVPIPDVILMQPKDVQVYVYVEDSSSGITYYEVNIPIIVRPRPTELYTPEQIDNYSSVMLEVSGVLEELEQMRDDVEDITEKASAAVNATEGWANVQVNAVSLNEGESATAVQSEDSEGNKTLEFGIPVGKTGEIGPTGKEGFSPIVSVETTETGHTVTITDSEGDHSFEVRNGADGGLAESVLWENIVDKPSLAPEEHTHTAEEVGALPVDEYGYTIHTIKFAPDSRYYHVAGLGYEVRDMEQYPVLALQNRNNLQFLGANRGSDWLFRFSNQDTNVYKIYDEKNKPTPEAIGAHPNTWMPVMSDIEGLEDSLASAGKVKTVNSIESDENGNIEITAVDLGAIYVERTDEEVGVPPLIDADTLGGLSHDQYALKQDIPNLDDVQVTWDEVQNVPSEFSPTAHGHDIGDVSGISYEEWVFTYEDGTTETKKVILGV